MDSISVQAFTGVNQAQKPELIDKTELATWENAVLNTTSSGNIINRRGAFSTFNTNTIPTQTLSLHDVRDSVGSNYLLASTSTKLIKSADGTGAWSDVKTGLTTGKKTKITNFADNIIVTNDTDVPFMVTGTALATVRDFTIARPDISGMGSRHAYIGAGTSLTVGKRYHYIIVYKTATGEISVPSLPFTHYCENTSYLSTKTSVSDVIGITGIPVPSDTRVTSKIIYRTQGNGDVFYFLARLDVATTQFDDRFPDTSLDLTQNVEYLYDIRNAKYSAQNRERMFFGNVNTTLKNYFGTPLSKIGTFSTYNDGYTTTATGTTGVGGLTLLGTYSYAFVFEDENGNKTDPIYVSGTLTGTQVVMTIAMFPNRYLLSKLGFVYLKIYRSVANSTANYYLLDTEVVDYSNTTITDTISDITIINNAQLVYSTKRYANSIIFSEIAQPTKISTSNVRNIFPDDNDEITGIFDDRNGILIFKKNSICKLYTDGVPTQWRLEKLVENIGATDPFTIVKTEDGYYFVNYQTVYLYSQGAVRIMSEKLKATMGGSTFGDAVYIPSKKWYCLSATRGSFTYIYIYDEIYQTWYVFKQTRIFSCVGIKRYGTYAGVLLSTSYLDSGSANDTIVYYDESSTLDSGNQKMSLNIRTKAFSFPDTISLMRIRHFFINFKKQNDTTYSDNVVTITLFNPDGTTVNTYTVSAGSGWLTNKQAVSPSGNFKIENKMQLEIVGAVLSLAGIRVDYRQVKRGYGIGN